MANKKINVKPTKSGKDFVSRSLEDVFSEIGKALIKGAIEEEKKKSSNK